MHVHSYMFGSLARCFNPRNPDSQLKASHAFLIPGISYRQKVVSKGNHKLTCVSPGSVLHQIKLFILHKIDYVASCGWDAHIQSDIHLFL